MIQFEFFCAIRRLHKDSLLYRNHWGEIRQWRLCKFTKSFWIGRIFQPLDRQHRAELLHPHRNLGPRPRSRIRIDAVRVTSSWAWLRISRSVLTRAGPMPGPYLFWNQQLSTISRFSLISSPTINPFQGFSSFAPQHSPSKLDSAFGLSSVSRFLLVLILADCRIANACLSESILR